MEPQLAPSGSSHVNSSGGLSNSKTSDLSVRVPKTLQAGIPLRGQGIPFAANSVTENPGIKPRNTNVVLKGRHSLLQRWMHGG